MIDNTYTTIVSLLPYTFVENKPGLTPNEYTINGRGNDQIGLTVLPNKVFYLVNPDPLADAKEVRNIQVPVPSQELAESLINDYISALLGVEPPEIVPGLFYISGNHYDAKIVLVSFENKIQFYREAQLRWFQNLVAMADDTWAKSRSPLTISDLQREAAKSLAYERDWLNPVPTELVSKCPFCQNPINPGAVKCMSCNEVLDKKKYAELVGAK